MVLQLRRLACLIHILRPSIEGAFLLDKSRPSVFADFLSRKEHCLQHRMTTEKSNADDATSWATSLGQQDIGRSIIKATSDVDEQADDTDEYVEKGATSLDTLANVNGDESSIINNKSWREYLDISIARSRKIRGSNYVQIATLDSTANEPRCRTVVFRGFLNVSSINTAGATTSEGSTTSTSSCIIDAASNEPLPCVMKMCTDLRSEKVHQTGPTEVVWWFPKTSEQYRIRGKMVLIGNETSIEHNRELAIARKELWGSLTDSSRESFLTTQRPGDIYTNEASAKVIDLDTSNRIFGGRDANGKVIQPPPESFLLMLVVPNRCDYLNLSNMFRQIDVLKDGNWQAQRVNA